MKTKIDGESGLNRLLVEKAKLIIAKQLLCFKMLEYLKAEIDRITNNLVENVHDFSVSLSLLEYVANYVESSSRISDQMKVLFEKLDESSLIYINEQLESMLTRSVNKKELLLKTQKILQEEIAKKNGEERGFLEAIY